MDETWHCVAKINDLDPEYPSRILIGKTEFAVCIVGDQVFAVDNICSHAYARLSDGLIEDFNICCPLHSGSFDLRSGEPTAAPCVSPIKTYPTKIEDQDVFVRWE